MSDGRFMLMVYALADSSQRAHWGRRQKRDQTDTSKL